MYSVLTCSMYLILYYCKRLFLNDRHPITMIDDLDGFKDIHNVNDALLMVGLFINQSIYCMCHNICLNWCIE